jgi:hypothetical protein
MNIPKNFVLWVTLAIPVLMILFVAGAIYLPHRGVEAPTHNFVYALRDYSDGYDYVVIEGKLVRREFPDSSRPASEKNVQAPTRFFLHDVAANVSKEITLGEAQKLRLDNSVTSPDGYELKRGGQGGGIFPFFFSEGNYNKQYLVKANRAIELQLKEIGEPYYYNQVFLGWVME